jgi:hypothetical protein
MLSSLLVVENKNMLKLIILGIQFEKYTIQCIKIYFIFKFFYLNLNFLFKNTFFH